jgi:hypothetical protein
VLTEDAVKAWEAVITLLAHEAVPNNEPVIPLLALIIEAVTLPVILTILCFIFKVENAPSPPVLPKFTVCCAWSNRV